jgi:TadE-like protein
VQLFTQRHEVAGVDDGHLGPVNLIEVAKARHWMFKRPQRTPLSAMLARHRFTKSRARFALGRSGAAVAEFALILPAFLALLFAMVQGGLLLIGYNL